MIYKRARDKNYTGVCLDLDIVEEGSDPVVLKQSLEEAAQGYLEIVCKENLSEKLLNKPAPKKYWSVIQDLEKYFHLLNQISQTKRSLPIEDSQVFSKNIRDLVCV
ncbi:MAG: hypothetical protein NTW79_02440 [Candidatus Berkelbacteria bacterium]|nr:hypothetical protein [Candidatus Berkelbacteria bacterium]